jgi:sulfane dehydrogenase subunit SoxC
MSKRLPDPNPVAGNGLLHRREFLTGGAFAAGAAGAAMMVARPAVAAPPDTPAWMKTPGAGMSPYGARSSFESDVQRLVGSAAGTVGAGASRTPLERLEGIITPNALHFERHHNGIPNIDPAEHRLLIHGLVDRPLIFDLDALARYPLVSAIRFIECSGNGRANLGAEPALQSPGELHGLLSCADWTGVPVGVLLDEAGVGPEARWIVAEGADAAAMVRSIPMAKALDDAVIALYQNGERLRPSNGYPMRLLLPGWEGNTSVKWIRRIQVTSEPAMARDETSKYTDLLPDGRAEMFTFPMSVKSVITSPGGGAAMQVPGIYQISGLAWSGGGRIRRVEVSADGGRSWTDAELSGPVLPKALVRFRLPWRWDGGPTVLQSRATDETGAVQPTRDALISERGTKFNYHYYAIQSWGVRETGEVVNVYG